jgi:DNA anti-recombination protein RmuC
MPFKHRGVSMVASTYIIAAISIIVMVAAFYAGRYLFASKSSSQFSLDQTSAVTIARLQERERLLVDQVKKLEDQALTLNADLEASARQLIEARQQCATYDERIGGLDKALVREKELSEAAQQKLSSSLDDANKAKEHLQAALTEQSKKLAAAESLETELRGQINRAGQHITDRDETIKGLSVEIKAMSATLAARDSDLATAAEREAGLNRTIAERDEQLKGLQERLKTEFENIANKVLAMTADQLSEKSQESLTAILDPLKARISEFQQKVEST